MRDAGIDSRLALRSNKLQVLAWRVFNAPMLLLDTPTCAASEYLAADPDVRTPHPNPFIDRRHRRVPRRREPATAPDRSALRPRRIRPRQFRGKGAPFGPRPVLS